jgi:uncharacterized membrane protein YphA (DoxX/SURF4 family)
MTRKIIVDIAIFLYVLVFVYAAVTKLRDYPKFVVQLGQSPIVTNYSKYLAWGVPSFELVIAVLLIVPITRLLALYTGFSLMVMFTVYIILASRFSEYVPCSCGGVLEGMTWSQHLVFNAVLVVLGFAACLIYPRTPGSIQVSAR